MITTLSNLDSLYRMRKNKVTKFRAKIYIQKQVGSFLFKTIDDAQELKEALELRYQVFHREMIGKRRPLGIDVDEFDQFSDHLVVKDLKNNKIVGTYRLNSSLFSRDFYSGKEFNLTRILSYGGVKLELGRACIHKDYRRGSVIALLWKGISEYMEAIDAQIIFGCATVMTGSTENAALLHRYFIEEKRINPDYLAWPIGDYKIENLDLWKNRYSGPLSEKSRQEAEKLLPSLCRSYLNAGAFIGGDPAYDEEFDCLDFLTVMLRSNLSRNVRRRVGA